MKCNIYIFIFIIIFSPFLPAADLHKVAIMDLFNVNTENYISTAVSDILTTALTDTRIFTVTEKDYTQLAINKLNYEPGQETDEEFIKTLGNKLLIDLIITGNITIQNNIIYVTLKVMSTVSGTYLYGKKINGKNLDDLIDPIEDFATTLAGLKIEHLTVDRQKTASKTDKAPRKEPVKSIILPPLKKAGIILTASGGTVLAGGLVLFLVDILYLSPINLENRTSGNSYDEYKTTYIQDLTFFITGISAMGIGLIVAVIGIPLMVIKSKDISFQITPGNNLIFCWTYQFN